MKKICCIYIIRNLINGKRYIGSTVDFKTRKSLHLSHLRRGIHKNIYLQRSYNKYKEISFKFFILETITNKDIIRLKEEYYLKTFKPEYNMRSVDLNSNKWSPLSEETKIKMSYKKRKLTDEQIKEVKNLHKQSLSNIEISKIYDVHSSMISRIINERNRYTDDRSKREGERKIIPYKKVKKEDWNIIIKRYRNKEATQCSLAKIYNIDPSSISKMLKKYSNAL